MGKSKLIRCQCPEGFKLVVEESFQSEALGARIFVFENSKKERLYCKLCEPSDIEKGFVWQVLSPEQLRLVDIQESYNQVIFGEGKAVEESVPEDELWNPEQETLEQYKQRTGRDPKKGAISGKGISDLASKAGEVNIYVSGKNEGEEPSKEELESENQDLKNKLSLLAQQEFEAKKRRLGAPTGITTVEGLQAWEAEHDADPTKRGSSGTLSLEGNLSSDFGEGYNSYEEMIDDLQKRKRSHDDKVRKEAQAVIDELWRKMLSGKKAFKAKEFEKEFEVKGKLLKRNKKEEDES